MKNNELLEKVSVSLAKLPWKVVYLGGSTTHLHITDTSASDPEMTDDVDVVVALNSPVEFQVNLREKLREIGAREDTSEGAPLCRWILDGLQVDVMSPNENVLGFANRWYPLAVEASIRHSLDNGIEIDLITAVIFLATKFEAYQDRGRKNCLSSKDVEDIIGVIDGRAELANELKVAPKDLKHFIGTALQALEADPNFIYSIEGYLHEQPARAPRVQQRVRALIECAQSPQEK